MRNRPLVNSKQELAEAIMAHAIEKVHKLGFAMKVGRKSETKKIELGALNILYYHIAEDGKDETSDSILKSFAR